MTANTASRTVGELVAEMPARARIFEAHRIDYCCGGKIPLADACTAKSVDLQQVLAQLEACTPRGDAPDAADWTQRSLGELVDDIVTTHHEYLRSDLPRLGAMVEKVARVHGERHAELAEVLDVFRALQQELLAHMQKEEMILFPIVKRIEATGQVTANHCGSVANPIRVMEDEHDFAGRALEALRRLTNDYTPPEDGCNTFRVMLDGLAELERDLHTHIHKENNILFPRAIALEAELSAGVEA
ncbi:MAG TPA: iron-sulfur cluster repair di-iron protein [Phycisphaerae bacterium]|nr:iron-sulfur cluster repair di-iron protein [Phycisphaerales bacterium]HRX85094.1 iron-sulfur cluster repair di-iron protein [Phycisphaerae bacterium]